MLSSVSSRSFLVGVRAATWSSVSTTCCSQGTRFSALLACARLEEWVTNGGFSLSAVGLGDSARLASSALALGDLDKLPVGPFSLGGCTALWLASSSLSRDSAFWPGGDGESVG